MLSSLADRMFFRHETVVTLQINILKKSRQEKDKKTAWTDFRGPKSSTKLVVGTDKFYVGKTQNEDSMSEKQKISRPSLKLTILQPLLIIWKPLAQHKMGSFWHFSVGQNWLSLWNQRDSSFKSSNLPSMSVVSSSEKLLLYQLLLLSCIVSSQVNALLQIFLSQSIGSRPLIFTIYSFQKMVTATFENVCSRLAYETSSSAKMRCNTMFITAVSYMVYT